MSKTPRSYNQFCALAKALDIVGERWTLLVVRELLSGPKRFKDLQDALHGIGPNLLSARLKDMEQNGLVTKGKLPPPAASTVYELTQRGKGLGNAVKELVKWGLMLLDSPPGTGELFLPRWAMQALLAVFDADAAKGISETYEFRIDDEVFHIRVADGRAEGALGPANDPDLILSASGPEFFTLGFGSPPENYAIDNGLIIKGSAEMLQRFAHMFLRSARQSDALLV